MGSNDLSASHGPPRGAQGGPGADAAHARSGFGLVAVAVGIVVALSLVVIVELRGGPSPPAAPGADVRAPRGAATDPRPGGAAVADPAMPAPSVAAEPTGKDAETIRLIDRIADLIARTGLASADDQQAMLRLHKELVALGAAAAKPLAERLDRPGLSAGTREHLFHALRQLPGAEADTRVIQEARSGEGAMRAMAIESLSTRGSDATLDALEGIARHDPGKSGVFGLPRDPASTSTEAPDLETTPRLTAILALGESTRPRAAEVLADIVLRGDEEPARIEAARALGKHELGPRAAEALRGAAESDPSAYVRLQALQTLGRSAGPTLAPLLERIVARDRDAGVRAQAQQLLDALSGRGR